MTDSHLTLHLAPAEVEGLKRAFPDLPPADAAAALLRTALRTRYRRERRAGRVLNLPALKRAIEQS